MLALSAALAAPMAVRAQAAAPAAPAAAPVAAVAAAPAPMVSQSQRCTRIVPDSDPSEVMLGKSAVIPLKQRVTRVIVSGQAAAGSQGAGAAAGGQAPQGVADVEVMLLSPTDLFFRGRQSGTMNVVLQDASGACYIKDVIVSVDASALQARLRELLPDEPAVRVLSADKSIVLSGQISSPQRLQDLMSLALAYGGDSKRIVNLLSVGSSQQVMLEVKIAEVSKTLLDRLGASVGGLHTTSSGTMYSLISNFLSGGGGLVQALNIGSHSIKIDGQKDDGLVRVLAEPNIMAISGQQASFLSGGKIFIPVAQAPAAGTGTSTITLEEKEFGVGVKFTPVVLGDGRVSLKLVSEVSDLMQAGSPFTSVNGVTAVLPSMRVQRADTTVQLNDGQSLVIAGLIKNNVTEAIKRF
ncbi:MAG: type II and III secretion system protein family protein, partial [Proteobacteria bacterium]|nr:type II and III secretion system protein family protein [Pseudomonadota bacterium]